MANPTGKGGWVKGQSGNPKGATMHRQPRTSSELDVRKLAQRFTRPAIATAAAIMRNRDNNASVRLAAAELLLNRGHGRPIQPHSNPDLTPLDFNQMSLEQLLEASQRMRMALDQGMGPQTPPTEH